MKDVCIFYNTCDRIDFTRQTLPPILAEADQFDLFWCDGSKTDEGRNYHMTAFPRPEVFERHPNVTGGAVAAIKYSMVTGFNKGYKYIGLIENDVKLSPVWFAKTMGLFDVKFPKVTLEEYKGGPTENRMITEHEWKVGAASARCFTYRIGHPHPGNDYAEMADVGAGMIIIKREFIPHILNNFRRAALWEVRALYKHYTGLDYPIPPFVLKDDPKLEKEWFLSEDWYWPIVLLDRGHVTLATVPSMAYNLDDPDGFRDRVQREKIT